MHTDPPQLSSEQARAQLAAARTRTLGSPHDRAVHAGATAVFGVVLALYLATQNIRVDWVSQTVATAVFWVGWLITLWWVERAARTVPRRAKVWSRGGIIASFVLGLTVVLPWLNLSAQQAPNSWPMVLGAAAAAAVPALVAAAVIRWGSR